MWSKSIIFITYLMKYRMIILCIVCFPVKKHFKSFLDIYLPFYFLDFNSDYKPEKISISIFLCLKG